jgi:predicted alternative tryptophan synthase beta-subunit
MQTQVVLRDDQIPMAWYNVIPDMRGSLAPAINPRTGAPAAPEDLTPGCSLALANSFFGTETAVYMVRVSFTRKPYRKNLMEMWGADVIPITKMYTLEHDFVPPGIHAGSLRYPGDSALVSQLLHEGIVPASESSHAINGAVDEAVRAREEGRERTIPFCLSGHGNFDMAAYEDYLVGRLEDYAYPEELIRSSLANLPKVG